MDAQLAKTVRGFLAIGDTSAARTALEEGDGLDISDYESVMLMGEVLFRESRFAQSVRYYRAAVGIRGSSHLASFCLGLAYEKVGDKPSAIQAFQAAVAKNPGYQPALGKLADLGVSVPTPPPARREPVPPPPESRPPATRSIDHFNALQFPKREEDMEEQLKARERWQKEILKQDLRVLPGVVKLFLLAILVAIFCGWIALAVTTLR